MHRRIERRDRTVAAAAPSPDFSGTNVQVEGVDEPDIVKTDGKRIVSRRREAAARVGRDPAVLDTLTLPDGMYDAELLLAGDRILVFGTTGYAQSMWEDIAGDRPASARRTRPARASCRSTSRVITSRWATRSCSTAPTSRPA